MENETKVKINKAAVIGCILFVILWVLVIPWANNQNEQRIQKIENAHFCELCERSCPTDESEPE